jgi:RNA polymerase sigma-70 factor (ECF subfamily)
MEVSLMDEKELVRKAKKGDKQAFCQLYNNYKDRLYRYAYFRLGNDEDAKDAVSDCILNAYQSIYSLKDEKAFCSWIFKINYRSCCSLIKEQSRQKDFQDIDTLKGEASTYINYESAELLEALNILKDDEREIVLLASVAGYNSKEIAKLTLSKEGTVRSKLSRSLKKMREFLE